MDKLVDALRVSEADDHGNAYEAVAEPFTCSVCLCNVETQAVRVRTCGHRFHPSCLDAWLNCSNTCPPCRAEATEDRADEDEYDAMRRVYRRLNPRFTDEESRAAAFAIEMMFKCEMSRTAQQTTEFVCAIESTCLDRVMPDVVAAALYVLDELHFTYVDTTVLEITDDHRFIESVRAAYARLDPHATRFGPFSSTRSTRFLCAEHRLRMSHTVSVTSNFGISNPRPGVLCYVRYDELSLWAMYCIKRARSEGVTVFTRASSMFRNMCDAEKAVAEDAMRRSGEGIGDDLCMLDHYFGRID